MVENELTPLGELLLLLCMVWYGMVCGAITGIGVVWYITLSVAGELARRECEWIDNNEMGK